MKSDFEMIVKSLPKEDVVIYPIADLHIGDPEFDEEKWNAFVNELLGSHNTFCMLAGDMINNATKSSVSNVYAETMRPMEQKWYLSRLLAPIRDRIICAVPGNHERRSLKEVDDEPLYDVMCKLDLEDVYRPNIAFVELELGDSHNQYRIAVTHGNGDYRKNEAWGNVVEGLDALVTGHTHRGVVTKPQKLMVNPRTKEIEFRDFTVLTATAWNGYADYARQKQLFPNSGTLQKMICHYDPSHKAKRIEVSW